MTAIPLSRARILLIISGGIAAYKSLELIRRLRDRDATVRVVMTAAARQFISPLSAATLAYRDTTATAKVKAYYELVAVSPTGVLSAPGWVSTVRPAAPKVSKVR